jgi:putative acetyltransferase
MVIIRQEKPEDLSAIRLVNEQAFEQPDEANLVDALREGGKVSLSLVAEQKKRVVGHILFSPVVIVSEGEQFPALGLAPMAVLPELQRQGIGSLLVKHGLNKCREAGHKCVIVLGHPDYYPRFGFVPASRYGIKCQFPAPDDAFMAIELEQGAFQGLSGTVKYQPEFNGF